MATRDYVVEAWALNVVAHKIGSKRVVMPNDVLARMARLLEPMGHTVVSIDAIRLAEVLGALVYVAHYTDGSSFTLARVRNAIHAVSRVITAALPRVERARFSSNHDRGACPSLNALKASCPD